MTAAAERQIVHNAANRSRMECSNTSDLKQSVTAEAKLSADRLLLRQQDGFLSTNPAGRESFGSQFERVLPAGTYSWRT